MTAREVTPLFTGRRRLIVALVVVALLVAAGQARAREGGQVKPILRPVGLLDAKRICSDTTPRIECRAALRRQIAATAWQRDARLEDAKRANTYGVMHALRIAGALYGVPLSQMVAQATCESHLNPRARNRTSSASGLLQFLASTWTRAGLPGFSVFDPYANAIAAARLVHTDGSWREWSCQP